MFKQSLNIILYAIIGLLIIPTIAILATWDTLPNEPLYPVKRLLEKAALVVLSPSESASVNLHANLVERRTTEAVKVLGATSENTSILYELEVQADEAKNAVLQAKDPETKRQAAAKLVAKLQSTNESLESTKKSTVKPETAVLPSPTISPQITTTTIQSNPTPPPTAPTPLPTASAVTQPATPPDNVDEKIAETQQKISEIIEDLEKETEDEKEKPKEEKEMKPEKDKSEDKKGKDKE